MADRRSGTVAVHEALPAGQPGRVLARVGVRWGGPDAVPPGLGTVPDTRQVGRFERDTVTLGRVAYRGVTVRVGSQVRDGTEVGVRYDPDLRAVVAYDLRTGQPLATRAVDAEPRPPLPAGRDGAVSFVSATADKPAEVSDDSDLTDLDELEPRRGDAGSSHSNRPPTPPTSAAGADDGVVRLEGSDASGRTPDPGLVGWEADRPGVGRAELARVAREYGVPLVHLGAPAGVDYPWLWAAPRFPDTGLLLFHPALWVLM